jgi:FkbH-like protein
MYQDGATATDAQRAAEGIRELSRAGELALRYPEVIRLLIDVDGPELVRAGQLLSRVPASDVLAAHPATPVVRVAITGHGELSGLLAPLTAELARHGLLLVPYQAPFDSYVFELGSSGSPLYGFEPDVTLCLLDPAVFTDELPMPWRPADLRAIAERRLAVLHRLVETHRNAGRGALVLNTLPLPHGVAGQLIDHRSRAELGVLWREANSALLRLGVEQPTVTVLDLDPVLADGVPASEPRTAQYVRAHLSAALLARYATQVGHLARHLTGRTRKCLVLDLDNTVWGGILGDDGVEGIEVADSYRGEAYRAFQRAVKQIAGQGVLVAAVSKNEAEPVGQVLREHPRMTLREDDFVRVVANWRPKHENLVELAQQLNLGVDSLVFVDDSAYECGLVRHALPAVAVIQLDDEPALHAPKLLRDGWFDATELTSADRSRAASYRSELDRQVFLNNFDSLADYLRELRVMVRLATIGPAEVDRVAQLTLRTNQFNLTGERRQPVDIAALRADPAGLVLAVHAADRFGDSGLVGAVLGRWAGDALRIDNFVLSCRVFGRGIEHAVLSALLGHARRKGASVVLAGYRQTAKNGLVAELYPRHGFVLTEQHEDCVGFRHDLAAIQPAPEHVSLTEQFGGATE